MLPLSRLIAATALLLFLTTISTTYAYITDIKLVACDANHACANYPGYRRVPTDLNQGVNGASSIYLHIKEDPKEDPITDITIIGQNMTIPNQSKWTKLKVDLNQMGSDKEGVERPTSLWLYYTKDKSISKNPVTSIIVKQGTSPFVGAEYKRIPVDLNKDVGGFHLYMYYSQDGPKGIIDTYREYGDGGFNEILTIYVRSYYCYYRQTMFH